jgi:putative phage-type endonuclease
MVLGQGAPRGEWLAARRAGVTASEIAVILGLSPDGWDSAYALYHRKTGELPEDDHDSEAMALGRYLEEYVAARWHDRQPFPCGMQAALGGTWLFASTDRGWQLATPDRLLWTTRHDNGDDDADAVLEVKTTASYDGWGADGSSEIPVHYRCQLLWQMDVLGVTTGHMACLFLARRQIRSYVLRMDADAVADLAVMRAEGEAFLRRVQERRPPPVDWSPPTRVTLRRLNPKAEDREVSIPAGLAARYRSACLQYKRAERRKAAAENVLRQRMGTAARAAGPDGELVATRQVYELPEAVITRKAATVDKLVLSKSRGQR